MDFRAEKIRKVLKKHYKEKALNGSVLISENDDVIFKGGFGYANMEWNILNEADTKHTLGSITKQFTAMLVLQLVEKGKIGLNDKISDYLLYYDKNIGKKVSIYHLLTHTSGIPDFTEKEGFLGDKIRKEYNLKELILNHCTKELEFKPGSKCKYSNSGYVILGAIIKKVTNKHFKDVLKENILIPLNMKNTGYDDYYSILDKKASDYEATDSGFKKAEYWDRSTAYTAGAMYTTVEDLFIWNKALFSNELLSLKYTKLLLKPNLNNYACGCFVVKTYVNEIKKALDKLFDYIPPDNEEKEKVTVVFHHGGIYGVSTLILNILETKQCIIQLNNIDKSKRNVVTKDILDILMKKNK
ncbi:MAG: beta-lactamase family protein [Firmicutes bacterium]|nr:beta-lactamase family protein [Bacillota bacterium]